MWRARSFSCLPELLLPSGPALPIARSRGEARAQETTALPFHGHQKGPTRVSCATCRAKRAALNLDLVQYCAVGGRDRLIEKFLQYWPLPIGAGSAPGSRSFIGDEAAGSRVDSVVSPSANIVCG